MTYGTVAGTVTTEASKSLEFSSTAAGQYSLIIDGAAWAAVEFGAERLQDKVTSVVLTRAMCNGKMRF